MNFQNIQRNVFILVINNSRGTPTKKYVAENCPVASAHTHHILHKNFNNHVYKIPNLNVSSSNVNIYKYNLKILQLLQCKVW